MDQATSNAPTTPSQAENSGPVFVPPADIIEKDNTVVMLLDLPGADPASLDITLDKRVLSISAKTNAPVPQGYAPVHIEFQNGTYERRFIFSDQMDGEHVDAALRDGVLRLTVPKAPESGAKKIAVNAA